MITGSWRIELHPAFSVELTAQWDALLAASEFQSVYQSAGWLASWLEAIGSNRAGEVTIACAYETETHADVDQPPALVAACALSAKDGVAELLSRERADYGDVLVARSLSDEQQVACVEQMLQHYLDQHPGVKSIVLHQAPEDSFVYRKLVPMAQNLYCTVSQHEVAPTMRADKFAAAVKKKSLTRHHNRLRRQGELDIQTYVERDDIAPRMAQFFDLHKARWRDTKTPSLFEKPVNRQFYCQLAEHLAPAGIIRYTEVTLDGELLAAHFGFVSDERFIWYKPCFNPEWSKFSPGEVLLRALIERAEAENVKEFDFTIGGEGFKLRFADHVRDVIDVHVTDSQFGAMIKRLRVWLKGVLLQRSDKKHL